MEDNNAKSTTSFSAVVMFLDSGEEETFDVEIGKRAEDLTYDEVEDAVIEAVDASRGYTDESHEDGSPYEIVSIVVNDGDEPCPVISETDDDSSLKNSMVYDKYLVLPWATYELTPEAKMWMSMKDSKLISEDAPFDYEKYHKLVSIMK